MPFRCSRTGMIYPDDYIELWGRKYGIGLGSKPVSEALVNSYHMPVSIPESDAKRAMHPLEVCQAQMDFIPEASITAADRTAGKDKPVFAIDDPDMRVRADLMREKQLEKSARLRSILSPVTGAEA